MNWLLKLLGYHDRGYAGGDFCVNIEPRQREGLSVIHLRDGNRTELKGEGTGKKWEGIAVSIPQELDSTRTAQLVSDLVTAFRSMGYEFEISRPSSIESVPEDERQAALAELREMGYEIEVSPDRKQIRQRRIPGVPRPDINAARTQAPRMIKLLQSVHGTRQRLEILAKSNKT